MRLKKIQLRFFFSLRNFFFGSQNMAEIFDQLRFEFYSIQDQQTFTKYLLFLLLFLSANNLQNFHVSGSSLLPDNFMSETCLV